MTVSLAVATAPAPPRVPRPRDSQRSRVYRAEMPMPASPLPGLSACAVFAERVVGTLWWTARFPELTLDRIPRLRPGNGARQAFYREDPDGPTITLPRRYRTKGVVLHELAHWAMSDAVDLPEHGATFARIVLDATEAFLGEDRAAELTAAYRAHRVRVAEPPRAGPTGRLHYGWDERITRRRGRTVRVYHGHSCEPTVGTLLGANRTRRIVSIGIGHDTTSIPTGTIWDIRP